MYEKIISAKVEKLPASKKSMITGIMVGSCGNRAGRMKYVPIEGIDLEGFSNRCVGTDADLYLNCLIDAISIISVMNTDNEICLCDDKNLSVAKAFGVNVSSFVTKDEVLQSWSEDVVDVDIYKDGEDSKVDYEEDLSEDEEDVEEEDYEDTSDKDNSEDALREEIKKVFNTAVISLVSKVKKRYDLLFESGYDLERPYGIISEEGVLYTDSEKVLKTREDVSKDIDFSASLNIFELFKSKIGFNVSDARSSKVISQDMLDGFLNSSNLNYFPYKLIEYAYGRNPSNVESRNYAYATMKVNGASKGISTQWGEFGKKVVEDVRITIEDSIVIYCLNVLNTGYDRDDIRKVIRNSEKIKEIQSYMEYVADSLSVCVLITQYKSNNASPVVMKMRVCDPRGTLSNDMTEEIILKAFSGNAGGSQGVTLLSGLNNSDSMQYRVFEYGHEFNHSLSNAMPLFAYRAFEKLKEKGESISYKDLILGQSVDGTILRNGTHGLVLAKKLFHYINAGSRSGKGVMTLNMLAGALLSNKAIIYLDDKPDMVSMLSQLCGGKEYGNEKGPLFFGLNGSNNVDDKQHQFTNADMWINRANIPIEAVVLFGDPSWQKYGEIFYMRAFMLAFGIILARGLDGGHGKMNDPMYNGTDGIYLVCDETNVLQENFKVIGQILADKIPLQAKKFLSLSASLESIYQEANSDNARKGANLKFANAKRDFEEAFNAHKFYALSYLNSLSDNIAYIYQKSLAGFLPKEAECSDVVIIGQNLEQIPITKDSITSAVTSGRLSGEGSGANGLGGTQIAKEIKGAASIPLAHFVFSSADALIGYNSLHPEYLAQGDKGSKAFGRLDLTANNFCYLPNFKISASAEEAPGNQLTKNLANSESSVYFKPYLILNDSSPAYTNQMFDRVRNAGINEKDVISEYPNDTGDNISPFVGFPEYMSLMGVSDVSSRLKKGAEIANRVVGEVLGYPDDGSGRPLWLQFVTDLRPEWLLSVRDIACMCGGLESDANITKGKENPITKEYFSYIKYVSDHPELGITDNSISSPEAYFTDEDGNTQYDIGGYESKSRRDFYADDDGSDEDYEDEAFEDRMRSTLGDNTTYEDDEFIDDMFDNDEDNDGYRAFQDIEDDNVVENNEYKKVIDEKDAVIEMLLAKLSESGVNLDDLDGYRVDAQTDKGVDSGFDVPEYREEFKASEMQGMDFDEDDEELSATTFANLVNLVTNKVITQYGGYDRITTFRVVGGAIAVNGTVFRSKISKDCLGLLPLDIRRKLNAGNLAELFNYRELVNMRNLRVLAVDSVGFVYDQICPVLGFNDGVSIGNFFDLIQSLQTLKIGRNTFTRNSYKKEMLENDVFGNKSTATRYAAICDDNLSKLTSKSWNFTKNMFNSKNHGLVAKTFGVLFGGVASATVGAVAVGAKATKRVSQKIDNRSRRNRVKTGINAFKEGFSNLFKE